MGIFSLKLAKYLEIGAVKPLVIDEIFRRNIWELIEIFGFSIDR